MPPYFRCPAISKDGEIASDKVCQRELVSLVSTTGKPRPTALYGRWCFSSTDERRRRENIGPHATAAPNFAAKTWEAPMLPAVAGRRAPHLKWDDRGARFRGQQIFLFWREYLVTVERTLSHENASLRFRLGARHRICSASDQCLRVLVRTKSVVRARTACRGLRRSRRWVLVGQIVVSSPLASRLESRLAPRSAT
jgi:hypothetical protein